MSELNFFKDCQLDSGNFLDDTLCGLKAEPKSLHPKYLYDKYGAKLFADICETEEYYITRTETKLLDEIGEELAELAGQGVRLVEFGMGDGEKARKLLSLFQQPYGFVGIDISREQLQQQIKNMAQQFPHLDIGGICADFFNLTDMLPKNPSFCDIGFFPGSTIGNFNLAQQKELLNAMRKILNNKGSLIIGVDLQKSPEILEAAYDDEQGKTAAFSLNLLQRINRELNGDIDIDNFKHEAVYSVDEARVQICLRSLCQQTIHIEGLSFDIGKGEPIYTENAYKFTPQQFQKLARKTGWAPHKFWCDDKNLFSIHWLDAIE